MAGNAKFVGSRPTWRFTIRKFEVKAAMIPSKTLSPYASHATPIAIDEPVSSQSLPKTRAQRLQGWDAEPCS